MRTAPAGFDINRQEFPACPKGEHPPLERLVLYKSVFHSISLA